MIGDTDVAIGEKDIIPGIFGPLPNLTKLNLTKILKLVDWPRALNKGNRLNALGLLCHEQYICKQTINRTFFFWIFLDWRLKMTSSRIRLWFLLFTAGC